MKECVCVFNILGHSVTPNLKRSPVVYMCVCDKGSQTKQEQET